MENDILLKELIKIFQKVFNTIKIELSTTAKDVKGWDSLNHIILISKIEEHYNIKFELSEIINFTTVEDIYDCIKKKTNL
ncbi:MAG: acyl carrier protein [Bacteroidales bacterium]|nr:acyl carrier protein [Bacteroidales bacterium]